jgi:hypothetical protein
MLSHRPGMTPPIGESNNALAKMRISRSAMAAMPVDPFDDCVEQWLIVG